jgi:hypothetical protein
VAGASCKEGEIASPELGAVASPSRCTGDVKAVASARRVRRLGDRELEAVLGDLLGGANVESVASVVGGSTGQLIADPRVDGWETDARAFVVSGPKLDGYVELATKLTPALVKTAACRAAEPPRACAARFARTLATRAFGRSATDDEVSELLAVYDTGAATESADAGLGLVAEAVVLAPSTLYRSEIGVATDGASEATLTDAEIASQLSFLFSGARPDDALRAAANRGELHDARIVGEHARRLLGMPRARVQIQRLVDGWLELGKLDAARRSKAFPEFTPQGRAAMEAELHAFVEHVVFESTGTFDELLGASLPYPEAEHRRGVLSLPAFLTGHATFDATNPVDRGLFVRTRLFCQEIGAPPAQAFTMPVVAGADDGTTTRQKFEQHSTDALCKSCHARMDPIGFGLEGFDAIGRVRTSEHGLPVDDSGYLTDADVTGPFRGPAELADLVSRSEDARTCFVAQVVRFAEGETPGALCEVQSLRDAFAKSGRSITDLLLAYVARRELYVRRVVP